MKKILIVFVALFIINFGCKKIDENNGGGICACSPTKYPDLTLVVKNAAGDDLLNSVVTGAYTKDQIQLFSKNASGVVKHISFYLRPPFYYGNSKFKYNQIYSEEIVALSKVSGNTLYLKLGSAEPLELNLTVGNFKVEKLLIDKKEAAVDNATLSAYLTVFYLTL